jgi:hypothetical protein
MPAKAGIHALLTTNRWQKKESTSFFEKKEAKKLLLTAGRGRAGATAPKDQKFFASFFQKRSPSFRFRSKNLLQPATRRAFRLR